MSGETISLVRPPASANSARSWLFIPPRAIAALLLAWLLTRFIFDAQWNLVPDEAYYWVWSRHLALSYLDHPPVVAFLIRMGTLILGDTELGVRCLSAIIAGASVLILWRAGKEFVGDSRASAFIPIVLLVSPMVVVTGTIATPDAPALFFQIAALATALRIFTNPEHAARRWVCFGIFIGLALDSKYTSVLLGLSVALAMLSCADGRRQFFTPWPWIALAVASLLFSPVVIWNAAHQWASFRFQLHHGTAGGDAPAWKNLLDYVGGQLVVCTPVLFVACITAIVSFWRRKNNDMPLRILIWSATIPLVFFALSATRRRVEGNWPMFAYFPAVILFARYLTENRTRPRLVLAELAVVVAFCMTVILHAPSLVWKISPKLGSPQWDHLYGWRDLAQHGVEPLVFDSPVFTADYEYASELCFYLPGHPDVRPLTDANRPTAFDFFGGGVSPQDCDRAVLVRRLPKGYDAPPPWPALGPHFVYSDLNIPSQYKDGRQIRRSLIEIAERKP